MAPAVKRLAYLSLSLLTLFYSAACFGIGYIIQDLNLTTGQSYASAINQEGVVVGKVKKKEGYFDFAWSPDSDLQIFFPEASTSLPVINAHNEIFGIGWFTNFNGLKGGKSKKFYTADQYGILSDIAPPDSFPMPQLGGWRTEYRFDTHELAVLGVNSKSQCLIADFFDPAKARKFAIWMPERWFLGNKGQFKLLDNTKLHKAHFMNNQGMILGKYVEKRGSQFIFHIALYDTANEDVIPIFLDNEYTLTGFNDAGQVCGWKVSHKGSHFVGFLWDPILGMQSLGNFLPTAMNNHGQMVGQLKTATTYLDYFITSYPNAIAKIDNLKLYEWCPCVWVDNQAMPIRELVDMEGYPWTNILNLSGINDRGEIIGHALNQQNVQAFLLKPMP